MKFYFDINISKLNDVSNKFIGYTILMNDITSIKKAHEKLKIATEKQIGQERLLIHQSRLAAMGEIINMLAHQWRQPITTISMTVNNILLDLELGMSDKKQLTDLANNISQQTAFLSQTIDDFRDYFKPDEEKATVSLSSVIENSIRIIDPVFKNNHITVVKDFADTSNIKIYSKELEQVLISIVKNSTEAFKNKEENDKTITIKLYEVDDYINIDIFDNAGGIPDEIIDSIFNPYFSTKQEKDGTGIGLYMSDTIVKKHLNGTLTAQNFGNGAKFTIKLPINL